MTTARRKLLAGAFAALTVLAATTACSGSPDGADEILVYNAQREPLTKVWVDAFTRETGIKVTLRNGGDADLARQLVAEGEGSPADVFLTENSPAMAQVERAGLFADLDDATLAQVPAQYRPRSGKWTGIGARSAVFAYNTTALPADGLPASLLDLRQPQWKGRWSADTVGTDFQVIAAGLLAAQGEDATRAWLRGVKETAVSAPTDALALRTASTGRAEGALVFGDYWYRDQAGPRVDSAGTAPHYFRDGDPGAFVSIAGGGVLRSSKRAEAAQKFVRFVTSNAGQTALLNGFSKDYPVASGVLADPALPPLDTLQPPAIDPSALDAEKVTRLMTETGLV
ncbi:iron(III) transport system substrate-binding protein [Nocardia transvalensis]|uniref:Iron(III) transport system substrate-binding protein n=1 Tax=Nocardia transvalensis TaxID=37333 RepID=A0A7W9PFY1_9NOCA|nr:extracellular solute-binding protein [Nocardia transvalensis]MBB5914903.1 iron(III) transport system substrate-binding protein [Nocardia transvalensis]